MHRLPYCAESRMECRPNTPSSFFLYLCLYSFFSVTNITAPWIFGKQKEMCGVGSKPLFCLIKSINYNIKKAVWQVLWGLYSHVLCLYQQQVKTSGVCKYDNYMWFSGQLRGSNQLCKWDFLSVWVIAQDYWSSDWWLISLWYRHMWTKAGDVTNVIQI